MGIKREGVGLKVKMSKYANRRSGVDRIFQNFGLRFL